MPRSLCLALGLLALTASAAIAADSKAPPQTDAPPVDQLDIVGLKLGMTIDQAKAALLAYDPGMQIFPTYRMTNDLHEFVNSSLMYRYRHEEGNRKYKMPIGLIGQKINKYQDKTGTSVADIISKIQMTDNDAQALKDCQYAGDHFKEYYDKNKISPYDSPECRARDKIKNRLGESLPGPIGIDGEWFSLSFVPNETGGKLAAIVRTRSFGYVDSGLDRPSPDKLGVPTTESVRTAIGQKYGKAVAGGGLAVYDPRGRQLPPTNPNFARCAIRPSRQAKSYDVPVFRKYLVSPETSLGKLLKSTADLKEKLNDVLLEGTPEAEKYVERIAVDTVEDFSLNFETSVSGYVADARGTAYRACGTELAVSIDNYHENNGDVAYATTYSIGLLDVGTVFFDTGIKDWVAKHTPEAKPAPALQEKF